MSSFYTVHIPDTDEFTVLKEGRTPAEVQRALEVHFPQVSGATRREEGDDLFFERQTGGTKG
jgi:hypothetical protein